MPSAQFAATPSSFAVTAPAVPLTLAAGAAVSVQVKFSPSVPGAYAGTLVVTNNASNPSLSIPLSGSAAHSVRLNWIDSDVGVMGYSVYRSTQTGGPYTT